MNDFTRGVLFATGMFLFGKGLYELGKLREQQIDAERWREFRKTVEKVVEECKEES